MPKEKIDGGIPPEMYRDWGSDEPYEPDPADAGKPYLQILREWVESHCANKKKGEAK